MNLIPARVHVQEDGTKLAGVGFQVEAPPGFQPSADQNEIWIGVRPEAVRLNEKPTEDTPFAVQIRWVEHHGSRSIVHADLGGTIIKAAIPPDRAVSVDSAAWLGFTPKLATLLDGVTDSFDRDQPVPTAPPAPTNT